MHLIQAASHLAANWGSSLNIIHSSAESPVVTRNSVHNRNERNLPQRPDLERRVCEPPQDNKTAPKQVDISSVLGRAKSFKAQPCPFSSPKLSSIHSFSPRTVLDINVDTCLVATLPASYGLVVRLSNGVQWQSVVSAPKPNPERPDCLYQRRKGYKIALKFLHFP